jgi:hypothetical protein
MSIAGGVEMAAAISPHTMHVTDLDLQTLQRLLLER